MRLALTHYEAGCRNEVFLFWSPETGVQSQQDLGLIGMVLNIVLPRGIKMQL